MQQIEKLPGSFEELIRSADRPVLVDFWATWCAPCRMVAPVVKQLATRYKGRLLTVKVDVDRRPRIAGRYNVSAVPTLMLFSRGDPVLRIEGVRPFETVAQSIEPHLPSAGGGG